MTSLAERYSLEQGRVYLTGIQALVRVVLDHQRAERRHERDTATFVSGYPGSPLGGFDRELDRQLAAFPDLAITHVPGLNEDLAATAVWGSQLATSLPQPRQRGVLGVWYGKAPGVDRSADAIRHANLAGTGSFDGVLALVGDDPTSKSSTVPNASEGLLADLAMPVLYPADVQDALDLGVHAIACSRATGLWTAMKVIVDVADSAATALVGPDRVVPRMPTLELDGPPVAHRTHWRVLAPDSLELEQAQFDVKLELARRYAELNGVNQITVSSSDDWLGVVAGGKSYRDLCEAFDQLGLDADDLRRLGVRVLKLGMIYPLDPVALGRFADGLSQILVLEDKRAFVETQVKDLLFSRPAHPQVVGRRDERGDPLLPQGAEIDPVLIAGALMGRLRARGLAEPLEQAAARLQGIARRTAPIAPARTPFFCSGCPHNRATQAADDTLVGAGVGCHTMVLLAPEGKGDTRGMTQMGGEGAQWIGMAPYTERDHFVQNVGDGTFFHSASLALRWAIAADVNMTYKLLYNQTVAMTGGQDVAGGLTVPALTRMLAAEGVAKTIVTTDEPHRYRGVKLAAGVEVRPREQFQQVEAELAATPGVTVLIHDQQCAAEKRRLRKRGKLPTPDLQVVINERVCEGCGDCGRKSNCLSVLPVETELGRKTRIHQPSCNTDLTCLEGDCPSFMVVSNVDPGPRAQVTFPTSALPEPSVAESARIRLAGIGGTGVVTVSQVLGMAATLEGKHVSGLDQTGLAQKGGSVVSDVQISSEPPHGAMKAPAGAVDIYLALDLLSATAARNLAGCDPERTRAVISTDVTPTGEMVVDSERAAPAVDPLAASIDAVTCAAENVRLDAEGLALDLFGDSMPANLVALGVAYQMGAIPVGAQAIERALELNSTASEANRAAFAWGRAVVAAPEEVERARRPAEPAEEAPLDPAAVELVQRIGVDGELRRLMELRASDLVGYQSLAYASRYVGFVQRARELAAARLPDDDAIAAAVARHLYKLMAYKDEYEVARLHLSERDAIHARLGRDAKITWKLHPPLLRALGMRRKLGFGEWFAPAFRLLRAMRRLRGTGLDLFGLAEVRRVERALIGEYEQAVVEALERLSDDTRDLVRELCELPDLIRGYEEIKLDNVARYRQRLDELRELIASRGPALASA